MPYFEMFVFNVLQKVRGEWMECQLKSVAEFNSKGDITIRSSTTNAIQVSVYI